MAYSPEPLLFEGLDVPLAVRSGELVTGEYVQRRVVALERVLGRVDHAPMTSPSRYSLPHHGDLMVLEHADCLATEQFADGPATFGEREEDARATRSPRSLPPSSARRTLASSS